MNALRKLMDIKKSIGKNRYLQNEAIIAEELFERSRKC
jgi:hypothetical protein